MLQDPPKHLNAHPVEAFYTPFCPHERGLLVFLTLDHGFWRSGSCRACIWNMCRGTYSTICAHPRYVAMLLYLLEK
jgi:hypothetical protein